MDGTPNLLKSIAGKSSLALVIKILAVPLIYFTNLVIARLYGAEIMGTYYLAFNFILCLAAFCCLGLNNGLLRFVAVLQAESQAADIKKIFLPAMGLATMLSCLAAAALYGLRGWLAEYFHSLHLPAALKFMVLALPVYVAVTLFMETVRALGGVRLVVIQQNLITPLSFFILLIVLAYAGPSFIDPTGGLALSYLVAILLGLGFLAFSPQLRKTFSLTSGPGAAPISCSFGNLLAYSWPLFFNAVLWLSLAGLDSLILGFFTSPEVVAYYNAAIRTAPLVSLPLLAVNAVLPPLFSQFHQREDIHGLGMLAQTTARWMYFLSLPLALLLILLSSELLGFFGPNFTQASFALGVLAIGQLFNVAVGSVGYILMMTGHQWTLLVVQLIVGIVLLPLMMILAARFGLNGMACASSLGLAAVNVLMAWGVWRRLHIKPYAQKVGWANLGGLVAVGIFFASKPFLGVMGGAAMFSLVYLAMVARPLIQEFQTVLKQPQGMESIR